MTIGSTESEYMSFSACAQEVNFVSMLLFKINKVQKPWVIYEDNLGVILLANNRQVGIHKKYIGIFRYFLQGMVEDKYIDIEYIPIEHKPAEIMANKTLK